MIEKKEAELFAPIKAYFEAAGFAGDGEVAGIDLLMEKDGQTLAVELKKTLDFKSIQQAAIDQKTCDFVYIGIFRPSDLFSRSGKDKLYILKRLGIGLVCVSPRTMGVEVISEPVVSELSAFQKRNKKTAAAVRKELNSRKLKNNTGGVHQTKLMTAYKEEALLVLHHLIAMGGEGRSRDLRALTGDPKCTAILYNNYYGWFENVAKGIYRVTESGLAAAEEYKHIIAHLK